MIKQYFLKLKRKKITVLRNIAILIQDYYLEKNKGYSVEEIRKEIRDLGITQIEFKNGNIVIVLMRPGLLIGLHGNNINALEKFLRVKMKYKKLRIKEDEVIQWLFPYMPERGDLE